MPERILNVIGFLLLGLTNNFGYAMMLSAAVDIIGAQAPAAVILLCDILPSFLIGLAYPSFQHLIKIWVIIIIAAICAIIGFILAGTSEYSYILGLLGVIMISMQQGLGECSILAYSSLFQTSCVAAWGFGTGLAGLLSTFLFMLLTTILKISYTLIIWCFMPVIILFIVAFFITKPDQSYEPMQNEPLIESRPEGTAPKEVSELSADAYIKSLTVKQRLQILKPQLMIYLCFFFVFLFEYSVSQGVNPAYEFASNPGQFYTFACFALQIGVAAARSTLLFFHLPYILLPLMSIIQLINLVILSLNARFYFMNSFWGTLVYVGFVGLFGGLTYVHGMYWLQQKGKLKEKKFLLSAATLFLNFGILCASGVGSLLQMLLE